MSHLDLDPYVYETYHLGILSEWVACRAGHSGTVDPMWGPKSQNLGLSPADTTEG